MTLLADIFTAARETLSKPGAWTPEGGFAARTARGAHCRPVDPAAVKWSLCAAVYKAYFELRAADRISWEAVLAALTMAQGGRIGDWEISCTRTVTDIHAVLDIAIANARRDAA